MAPKTIVTPPTSPTSPATPATKTLPSEKMFTRAELEAEVKRVTAQEGFKLDANSLAEMMKVIVPTTIMAMEQAKNQTTHDITIKQLKARQALEEKCDICRQSVGDGKGRGCGGPWMRNKDGSFAMEKYTNEDGVESERRVESPEQFHVKMVVFPSDPIAVAQWDGVTINGAHYRSQSPSHEVWVPKVNNIAALILKFEEDQRIQQIGRKHLRSSGSLSGNGGRQVNGPTFT